MAKSPKIYMNEGSKVKRKPPESIEEAEKSCIASAYKLVQQRLDDGTATSQETVHFLKLATTREKNENELARARIEKEKAQAEALKKSEQSTDMYEQAINAFKSYSGHNDDDSDIY